MRREETPVLIVDDHPVFRFGLASALKARGFDDLQVSDGSVTDAACLTPPSGQGRPWVALLDVRLGAVDGIELCRRLRAAEHAPIVIILTTYEEAAVRQAARDAGAFAFLSKEADAREIIAAIEAGLRGEVTRIPEQRLPVFTEREREVLRLLCDGLDTKATAVRMGIGAATVKDHLDNVYRKLGVGDRLNAVRRAVELGLADLGRRAP